LTTFILLSAKSQSVAHGNDELATIAKSQGKAELARFLEIADL
jgi:hypothetical protein